MYFLLFALRLPLRLSSNRDLDLDASLDVDDDLLDDLGGSSQVDQALVDAHLVEIPGLGTLTAGGLAGLDRQNRILSVNRSSRAVPNDKTYHDLEGLGGQADGALGAEVLVLGALNELLADLLQSLNLAGGQGDAYELPLVGVSFAGVPNSGRVQGDGRILWTLGASPNSFSGLL